MLLLVFYVCTGCRICQLHLRRLRAKARRSENAEFHVRQLRRGSVKPSDLARSTKSPSVADQHVVHFLTCIDLADIVVESINALPGRRNGMAMVKLQRG